MGARPVRGRFGPRAACGPRDCRARRHRPVAAWARAPVRRRRGNSDCRSAHRRRRVRRDRRGGARRSRCVSASDRRACDRGAACRAGSGHTDAAGRSSRRIHPERRTGARRGAAASSRHRRRSATTSGRRCSSACTVFFEGQPNRSRARQTDDRLAELCNASRSSASV